MDFLRLGKRFLLKLVPLSQKSIREYLSKSSGTLSKVFPNFFQQELEEYKNLFYKALYLKEKLEKFKPKNRIRTS